MLHRQRTVKVDIKGPKHDDLQVNSFELTWCALKNCNLYASYGKLAATDSSE